jgi:hypothetical protein
MTAASTYIVSITAGGNEFFMPYDDHEWTVCGGYFAPVQFWIMPATTADAIMTALGSSGGSAREVTLKLGGPATPIVVSRVVVLGTAPADNPQRKYLLLTDVRWYFTRAWMAIDVNVRRRLGDTRLIGDVLTGTTIADTVAYAPWSINNGAAYDWVTFKNQVLDYLTTPRHGRPPLSWTTDAFSILDPFTPPKIVQETTTDAPGYAGLARAIESMPGASIYVALDGVLHVYERTPGAEADVVAALPPPLQGHGSLTLIDRSGLRPADVYRVYVDYELEVRFTYNASGTGLYGTVNANDPFLIPVLQVTDQQLKIPAGTYYGAIVRATDVIVGQGSWISQAEAFKAWVDPGLPTGKAKRWVGGASPLDLPILTDDIVARHWYGEALDRYTVGKFLNTYDPVWGGRIEELLRCYRTYFRVNPKFWDRVRHAWPVRAAIWDPTTGQRAPAPVYANFNLLPVDRPSSALIPDMSINVTDSYPDNTGLLKDGRPSGFHLKLVDKELGIIAIDRNALSKYPGAEKIGISPVQAPAQIDGAGLTDPTTQQLVLATTGANAWKCAVVFCVAPAAPNDLRRMYEIQVTPAAALASVGFAGSVPAGYGPDQELRTHLAQARIAWDDSTGSSDQIIGTIVGTGDTTVAITTNDPMSSVPNSAFPTPLTPINKTQELLPLAKAVAAARLLANLDHYVGELAVPMDGTLVPVGSIVSVTHKVLENRSVSKVTCSSHADPISAVDLLPASARALILQEIPNTQR